MNHRWPDIELREVLSLDLDSVRIDASETYDMVGVYSFGRGLFRREPQNGASTSYKFFYRLKPDHVVMSQLFGWEGALALSSEEFAGKYVSPQFPTFLCDPSRLDRKFLGWLIRRPAFWEDLGTRTKGMGDRRRTLNPEALLTSIIPLPPLPDQRRIVARIEELSAKIEEARGIRTEIETQRHRLLMAAYRRIAEDAPYKPMGEVAPLERRPISVDTEKEYPQIAVRSFGRGTFHKRPLVGSEVTWEKPYLVKSGDILISNIKAWEGAIAVASSVDDGRVGSHRYLTCVPARNVATSHFVCFHLLTFEGLSQVGDASPGSADRNRTLSIRSLLNIPIPAPAYEKQVWFDQIFQRVNALKRLQDQSAEELNALMPSILSRAFSGEL